MKILHLCLGNYFIDGLSYQENMLTKQHKLMGFDVSAIASLQSYDKNGNICYDLTAGEYINENGIPVTRIPYKKDNKIYHKVRKFKGLYKALEKADPHVIFIHNCQFADIKYVVKYLKNHSGVKVYVDNHADWSNSATNKVSSLIHKTLWRHCAKSIEPFAEKFYGVLPVRVRFLQEMYHLPKDKCQLLVMGADDELVQSAKAPQVRAEIREKYGIDKDDFLIIFGGKIDIFKKQILLLMDAVNEIENPKVKLILFGSCIEEMKAEVASRESERVKYIGWVNSDYSYPLFAASDLAVFPGRHSVFWEQVTGQGIPMIVKYLEGTTHVDIGGNVEFLYDDSEQEIKQKIEELLSNPDKYNSMKNVAQNDGMNHFSYKNIAKRAIECEEN